MKVKVGIIQTSPKPLAVTENLQETEKYIAEVVAQGAQLVVLPEMFNVGFYFGEKLMEVAETLTDGRTITWLQEQAHKHQIYIVTCIYEKYEGHFYNTMVMVGYEHDLQYYRKRNPSWEERLVWNRAEQPGPGIFATPFGRVGGAICFDSFAKETFLGFQKSGVQMIVVSACFAMKSKIEVPWWRPDLALVLSLLNYGSVRWAQRATEQMIPQYAIQQNVPVCFVNQGGTTHSPVSTPRLWPRADNFPVTINLLGNSQVCNAQGKKLVHTSNNQPFTAVTEVDIPEVADLPPVDRVDIPAQYFSSDYYFVNPPWLVKFFQTWMFWGYKAEYEERRQRHL